QPAQTHFQPAPSHSAGMTDAGHLQSLAPSHGIERLPNALAGLTIVLPCFNEEGNIADAIRYATAAAERCATGHEIVVVDDGSIDETASVAARLAERDRRVRVVVHTRNRGYGDAVRTGIAAARMPWVFMT